MAEITRLKAEELEAIRKRAEETSFENAYIKGDKWKGYEVKSVGNGVVIAEVACGTDAEFIAHAREDVPKLLAEIERLRVLAHEILDDYYNSERQLIGHFARNYDKEIASQAEYVAEYIRQIHGVDLGE